MDRALPMETVTKILLAINELLSLYKQGALGGEIMPEDANPKLDRDTDESYLYFTLPMALNYQRNSYTLWEAANKTYNDSDTAAIFSPAAVVDMSIEQLQTKMLKHKVAIQPNKHPQIWMQLSKTFHGFGGSVKSFFASQNYSVVAIKNYMITHKKLFPYLSGSKIMNYWLYVMEQYTTARFTDREHISIAPDTHVIQASIKLGLINEADITAPNIREHVSDLWSKILSGTGLCPIDVHTPLWLWSRGKFSVEIGSSTNKNSTCFELVYE